MKEQLPVFSEAAEQELNELISSRTRSSCYLDRELSWLQFNLRVLAESESQQVPLLERLNFLSIYQSNLEEFFMIRVGFLLHSRILTPDEQDEKTGWTAEVRLKKILREVSHQQKRELSAYKGVTDDLKSAGIDIISFRHISEADEAICRKLFAEMRPFLTPRVVDTRHPMPFLDNKEDCVAALLSKEKGSSEEELGLISLHGLPKWKVFEVDGRQKVAITGELVAHFAGLLFKKREIRQSCVFRITRNADVFIEELPQDRDYRESVGKMLRKRKRQQPVRIRISGKPTEKLLVPLLKSLDLTEKQAFISTVPLELGFGKALSAPEALRYIPRRPAETVHVAKGHLMETIRQKDILLSFPYQSMTPFIDLVYEAADDPEVISIRITLYRLASSSKLVAALAYAAGRGKDVTCILELRARFDEQNNIDYSEVLSAAGCSVCYGLPEQKVHSKLCLITSHHNGEVQYLTQIGTGNYNEVTSELYVDLSLLTADQQIGLDAVGFFDALTTGQVPPPGEKLWIAPLDYKSRLLDLLEQERQRGEDGYVAIKANGMNDIDVMGKLVECSQAGVTVELFVRGICCLRPGLQGLTENIKVRSVIGRYLEHSRIIVLGRDDRQKIFIGSGDLLNRNTRRRVEVFAEITDADIRRQILEIMEAFRQDREKAWDMLPDGSYIRQPDGQGTSSQERLYRYFSSLSVEEDKRAKRKRRGLFFWLRRKR